MATQQANKQTLPVAFKKLGYSDMVSLDKPFFSLEGSHYYFYIPEVSGSTDTRRIFLSELASKLNQKKIGFSCFYDEKKSTTPKSSVGKISFPGVSTSIVCKYYESSKKIETNIGLKPSNIIPSIVGKWLTPETIARNVKTYIKNKQAPKPLSDQINLLLKNSLTTDRDFIIDGEVSEILVPAEFFEVLTAIKMSVLLRNNEVELKKVLKFLDTSKRINYKFSQASPLKINIPVKSNFPLTDYEISFKPDNYDETIKVSVKSKVKSDNTNTLKLDQVFDTVADVGKWFRSLNSSLKREQYAQAQIAFAHLRFSTQQSKGSKGKAATKKRAAIPPKPAEKYAGKVKVGFPIDAVGHILQIPYLNLDKVVMRRSIIMDGTTKRAPNSKEVKLLGIACRKIGKSMARLNTKSDLSEVFTKKSEASILSAVSAFVSSNNKVAGKPATPDLINLGKFCEKLIEWASKESSPTKMYNFFEMFHKKVLEERAICYAITDSTRLKSPSGIKTKIIFKFETMINWDKLWIGMRQKGDDALGLDL